MKVLLINPWQSEVFPPPSLGYLQAVLKQAGVEVTACDLYEALQEKDEYDIVGVSFHSFSVKHAVGIRKAFKGRLVCGGHHPSALPQQMLEIGYDQVVIGEGENAMLEIIKGNTDKTILGTPCNLEELPFPDYTGFKGNWSMGIPIISSRGCPFNCSFCASADFWDRKWRMRSAENVVKEIIHSGYKQFMFEDDNFTLNRTRVLEICQELRKIGGLSWQCASRAETLIDDELCWNLRTAGCHTVWLGVESLSQESLDGCGKKTTVEKMLAGIKMAHTHSLQTMSQFIVGLPNDTKKNIDETIANIKKYKIGRKGSNILWILPNTDIHKKAKEKGFDDSIYLQNVELYYTFEQNIKTLQYWAKLINAA
jgi:radical SAM superfamily enzyme YgiQ (UPF0313 family)